MRKIIYFCDYCGKEISGFPFTIIASQACDDESWIGVKDIEPPDICAQCFPTVWELIQPGTLKKKDDGRKKLDHGRIMALHNAGWSAEKIADELKCDRSSIYYHINQEKKGERQC